MGFSKIAAALAVVTFCWSAAAAAEQDTGPGPMSREAEEIRALVGGALDVGVDAASLFDIDLNDENAVRVEAERLRSIVERGASPWPWDAGVPDGGIDATALDPALFEARVDLDRARLAFYVLPKAERDAIIARHKERRRLDDEARAAAEITDAEKKALEADEAHRRALEAAHKARSEAERLVAEETARLLDVAREQARFEAGLVKARQALDQRAEATLGLRREVRDLVEPGSDPAAADALYDRLRAYLRSSRDALAGAISERLSASAVPDDAGSRLGTLPVDVDVRDADRARTGVDATAARLRERERALRADSVSRLYDEVRSLNSDRLAMLSMLGEEKREAVTGFTLVGLDQAAAELRQMTLVLRYDLTAAIEWLSELGGSGRGRGTATAATAFVALKWLFAIAVFLWWRRRAAALIVGWRERILEEERRERVAEPSHLIRFLGFARRTHRPVEWLVLIWVLGWLLPSEVRGQVEVGLLSTVFSWVLCRSDSHARR